MAQIFHPSTNSIAKASIAGVLMSLVLLAFVAYAVDRSPYVTRVSVPIPQPIPFSHQHHVGGLGIDCRYCHASVETSPFAGIPAMETCMTCHSQIWRESPMLAVVRDSFAQNKPLVWNRVHDLPDYAYFDHSIHVQKGIGCVSCHGRIDEMPLTWKTQTLHMDWCLDCHRNLERHIRPKEHVFDMDWQTSGPQAALGRRLMHENHVQTYHLTDCVTCHR